MMNLRLLPGILLFALTSMATQSAPLELATATVVQSPRIYRFDGTIEAVNQSTIAAQTSGELVEVLVDVDNYVEQGALIIRLRDTAQRARHSQAKAELRTARVGLQAAQKEYDRISGIFRKKLISQAAMDKATTALNAAKAGMSASKAALEQATEQLAYTQIRAPFSGIVTRRHLERGEIATPGQPLISGISLDQLRVSVAVPQSLIGRVRRGAKARIQLPDKQTLAAGNITVFPFANPQSGTFEVRLDLPRSIPDLFPGMHAKVLFELGSQPELLIPAASVVYRSEVTATYVVTPQGKIQFRHIRTGHRRDGGMVRVLAGLEAGEQVAVDPIEAGSRLKQLADGQSHE